MWWVVLAIILVYLGFKFPMFGKVILGGISVIVVVCALWYFKSQYDDKVSKSRISKNEIDLVDLTLQPYYDKSSYRIVGKIRNRSASYTLTSLKIRNTMRDALPDGRSEIVGETTTWVFKTVPPGQARDVDESVHFSDIATARGTYSWQYEVIEIRGR